MEKCELECQKRECVCETESRQGQLCGLWSNMQERVLKADPLSHMDTHPHTVGHEGRAEDRRWSVGCAHRRLLSMNQLRG